MAKVVIGANYGDEGKGLTTDALSSASSLVIRYNGGGQAGHTVVTPEGKRHVFHHIGSGALRGASTWLSRFFIVNPLIFLNEYEELSGLTEAPIVFMDSECYITTPFDMMVNQALERKRGVDKRHGSCGFGINETIVRSANPNYCLKMNDVESGDAAGTLQVIYEEYLPKRLEELGLENQLDWITPYIDRLIEKFEDDMNNMHSQVTMTYGWDEDMDGDYSDDQILFEGAQGLRLDQNSPDFPHVTRSNTGLDNVLELMSEMNRESDPLNVLYVTRTYETRHGAGPLVGEIGRPFEKVEDKTNIPNPHQGSLRFAHLNLDRMFSDIKKDLQKAEGRLVVPNLMVTCMDQLDKKDVIPALWHREKVEMSPTDLAGLAQENKMGPTTWSYGPTRDTLKGVPDGLE